MKANYFNQNQYEKLILSLQEESKEKNAIIELLKDRIRKLTDRPIGLNTNPISNLDQLIKMINYN